MRSRSVGKLAPLALALTAMVGCSGGGSSSSGAPAAAEPAVTSLSGTSSKGIIVGGLVNAYAINADGTKGDKVASQTETDAKGKYSLTLNGGYVDGAPILIEITAKDGTLMRCDLATCGTDKAGNTVLFGQDYALASTFNLTAVLPKASGTSVAVNITPVTQMGASLALKRIQAGASPSDAAAVANAQVKNLLGIKGDITALPVVDITDAESVNAASADDLDYNLKAAGIVQAMRKDNAGLSVEAALATFVDQYVSDNGLADREDSDSSKLTLQEILESALELVEEVKKVDGVQSDKEEFTQSENELKTAEADKRTNGSTEVKQGEAPDDVGSEGLQAAKGMVKQIRDLAATANLSVNQQAFADQIEMAASAVEGDSDAVMEALGLALKAVGQSWEAHNSDDTSSQPADSQSTQEEPSQLLTVDVTEDGGSVTYAITEQIISLDTTDDGVENPVEVTVNLTAIDSGTSISDQQSTTAGSDDSVSEQSDLNATLDLLVRGSVSSEKLSIAIQDGSAISGTMTRSESATEKQTQNDDGTFREREVDRSGNGSLNADLAIALSQLQSVSEEGSLTSFEGRLAIVVDGFAFEEAFTEDTHPTHYTYEEWGENSRYTKSYSYSYKGAGSETNTLAGFSFNLSGKFSSSEDSLSASLGVDIGSFSETCEHDYERSGSGEFDWSTGWNETQTSIDNENCTEETEQNYTSALLTIIFDLDLVGSNDDVNVTATATRTGLRDGVLDIDLNYGGKSLAFDYDYQGYADEEPRGDRNKDVVITNHNNVILTLIEVENEEGATLLSGNITQNGLEYARVGEESGVVIVRYTDGTFESAM